MSTMPPESIKSTNELKELCHRVSEYERNEYGFIRKFDTLFNRAFDKSPRNFEEAREVLDIIFSTLEHINELVIPVDRYTRYESLPEVKLHLFSLSEPIFNKLESLIKTDEDIRDAMYWTYRGYLKPTKPLIDEVENEHLLQIYAGLFRETNPKKSEASYEEAVKIYDVLRIRLASHPEESASYSKKIRALHPKFSDKKVDALLARAGLKTPEPVKPEITKDWRQRFLRRRRQAAEGSGESDTESLLPKGLGK